MAVAKKKAVKKEKIEKHIIAKPINPKPMKYKPKPEIKEQAKDRINKLQVGEKTILNVLLKHKDIVKLILEG